MAPFLITVDDYRQIIMRRYVSSVYIVLWHRVRLSGYGQRDRATSSRAEVTTSHDVVYAAYCYTHAAVARSVHPRGLLLLGLWSNNWEANVQAPPCFSSCYYYCLCIISIPLCACAECLPQRKRSSAHSSRW